MLLLAVQIPLLSFLVATTERLARVDVLHKHRNVVFICVVAREGVSPTVLLLLGFTKLEPKPTRDSWWNGGSVSSTNTTSLCTRTPGTPHTVGIPVTKAARVSFARWYTHASLIRTIPSQSWHANAKTGSTIPIRITRGACTARTSASTRPLHI